MHLTNPLFTSRYCRRQSHMTGISSLVKPPQQFQSPLSSTNLAGEQYHGHNSFPACGLHPQPVMQGQDIPE